MEDSVLTRIFGDSVNLRILSFFIENPFDSYTVSQISEFAEVSRNSVYNYLPLFLEKAHIVQEKNGSRDVYRLNRSSRIVDILDRFVDGVGDINLQPQINGKRQASLQKPNIEIDKKSDHWKWGTVKEEKDGRINIKLNLKNVSTFQMSINH